MVAAFGRPETVFSVLGQAARKRRASTLIAQLIFSIVIGAVILVRAPNWWSLAFLAGWSAAYSAWGLVVRIAESHEHPRSLSALLTAIATLGTVLAIAGMIGVGFAIYTGDAAGAKNRCGQTSGKRCEAAERPPLTKLP
jgi:hypothetical protein